MSSVSEQVKQWIAEGELLNLKDESLRAYVQDQKTALAASEREERKLRREHEANLQKSQREHEERMFEKKVNEDLRQRLELEKQKNEMEITKMKVTQELKEKEQAAKLEHARLKLEMSQQNNDSESSVSDSDEEKTNYGCRPRLPKFDEKKDNIDAFLFRFEQHASFVKWPKHTWSGALANLLTGAALEVYRGLGTRAANYHTLRDELLKKYMCTQEGFRVKFRQCKPDSEESFSVYVTRLRHLFERWLEMAGLDHLDESHTFLFLQEQIYQACSKELVTHFMLRKPSSLEELIEIGEAYREANRGKNLCKKTDKVENFSAAAADTSGQFPKKKKPFHGRGSYRGRGRGSNHQNADRNQNTNDKDSGNKTHYDLICRRCQGKGHYARDCPSPANASVLLHADSGSGEPDQSSDPSSDSDVDSPCQDEDWLGQLSFSTGLVDNKAVRVLRDTGCTTAGVRSSLVRDEHLTGEKLSCKTFGGTVETFPIALMTVDTPYYQGKLRCCVLEDPCADLIIGNVPGVTQVPIVESVPGNAMSNVVTRARTALGSGNKKPLVVPNIPNLDITHEELKALQQKEESFKKFYAYAENGTVINRSGNKSVKYVVEDGFLYRLFDQNGDVTHQLLVPASLRHSVLVAAHDAVMSGHPGKRRTLARVLSSFFWPTVRKDVSRYCSTCDICQKTSQRGRVSPVPLVQMPQIEEPFKRVAIDLVGEIKPPSASGHRYVLTLVDMATRFPEAIPLKTIDTVSVAEALVSIFARMGCPQEILSDNGPQFVSDLMKEVYRLLSIKPLNTTPYHAQANGRVERFNGVLKTMIRRVASDRPRDWDRYIAPLLFSYRELPNESTGFSPFELMFGRSPRGPMALLKDMWTGSDVDKQSKPVYQYVFDLQNKLTDTCRLAQENAEKASKKYQYYHDKKARERSLKVGDKVLVLLPDSQNKLLMKWLGPFRVISVRSPVNYMIAMGSHEKVFHINMLKMYHDRSTPTDVTPPCCVMTPSPPDVSVGQTVELTDKVPPQSCIEAPHQKVLKDACSDHVFPFAECEIPKVSECPTASVAVVSEETDDVIEIPTVPSVQHETVDDIKYSPSCSPVQKQQLCDVFSQYTEILTDCPGKNVTLETHSVTLTSDKPIRKKMYPLPFSSVEKVNKEVDTMIELGVIEPSNSPYSSPFLMVKKPDGSFRFCIDYRKLNEITVFDAEPIPDLEELFTQLSSSRFFTKIDLSKGYWQLPVKEQDRHKTAFQTPKGLFQWTRMPFGLVSAPATFARMMRKLRLEENSALNFFDDILVKSQTWNSHLQSVSDVLAKLRFHGLTARPSKIHAGFQELEFLGHIVGSGSMKPESSKVKKILSVSIPKTKKQVRSVLGLLSYYRRYVPDFASLTAPLSDLTKGDSPKQITWSEECDSALTKIQEFLSSSPILILPDLEKEFVVRTDASNSGVGAVLLQEKDDLLHPVLYASRKLLDRESRYSTVERECLAIVWALTKFSRYLYGQDFVLQTDHKPLQYLKQSVHKNARLMRWSLALQEFRFRVEAISGTANSHADVMSRCKRDQVV